jgi:SOS-response transcriptional repressor LexA
MTDNETKAFMERLSKFAAANNTSINGITAVIGKSNSYFRNTFQGGGYIRKDVWDLIREKIDPLVNPEWIERGVGEMRLEPVPDLSGSMIPLLPIAAQGGSLSDFEGSVMDYECERIISPVKEATIAITVTGDSMSPEYPNGSKVFIKKVNEAAFIDWGETFVLDTVNGIIIKNIFPCKIDDKQVTCHSINPNYPDFNVFRVDIRGWYRVLAVIALK